MSLIHRCDRCQKTSDNFASVDDLPDGWRTITLPVRGSKGARSTQEATICTTCDDKLYDWFRYDKAGNLR